MWAKAALCTVGVIMAKIKALTVVHITSAFFQLFSFVDVELVSVLKVKHFHCVDLYFCVG